MNSLIKNKNKAVILKKGKDKPIKNRHHWIFSGAIETLPSFDDGEILSVTSFEGHFLGLAYFNRKGAISGRMISFTDQLRLEELLERAILLRKQFFDENETNAYRLINGEGDSLPGLVVDKYSDVLVVQISTLGMERLKEAVVKYLKEALKPSAIYEKSLIPSRKEEGLSDFQGPLSGPIPAKEIIITENGLKFGVSILHGQKTGFFLDHREMRQQIKTLSMGKRVLNCFSYTGGFSVYAADGGAIKCDSVDISLSATQGAERNMALNNFTSKNHQYFTADVFEFLRERALDYELVVLDPPAFVKRLKDQVAGCRGYKDINRLAIQKMPKGSILLTSSCSYHVDEELFQKVVFQASREADRTVRIIGRHQMGKDHPINICHPEGDYLKSLLLYIE
jgi:23S rRNA (cytosine1962-C5)-methyltransferase